MKLPIITVNLNNLEGLKKMNNMLTDIFNKIAISVSAIYRKHKISLVLFLLMFVNLVYMHYVVVTDNFQHTFRYWRAPFIFAGFDILAVLLFFSLVTWRRRKLTYILSYVFIGFLVLANIIYSRFFHTYFSPSVLSEISNFKGVWWLEYIQDAFRWSDLLLVITTIMFLLCLREKAWYKMRVNIMTLTLLIILTCGAQVLKDARNNNLTDFITFINSIAGKSNYSANTHAAAIHA